MKLLVKVLQALKNSISISISITKVAQKLVFQVKNTMSTVKMNLTQKFAVSVAGISLSFAGIQANPAMAITLQTSDFITDSERTNFNGFEGLPDSSSYGSVKA